MKVYVENHGCSANLAIAERMAGELSLQHHQLVSSASDADVVVLNTCVVKQNTEHHMKSLIKKYSHDHKLIVTGCMTKIQSNWIQENVTHLENVAILSPDASSQITTVIEQFNNGGNDQHVVPMKELTLFPKTLGIKKHTNPTIGIIEIARGCLSHCTYCIVKFIRGRVKSRTIDDIVAEIRHEVQEQGVKEIWLTATDVGAYGKDLRPRKSIADLIENILEQVPGQYRIRMGMLTYWSIRKCYDKLLHLMHDRRLYKFLHLPIQSGSNKILKAMKRIGTAEEWLEFVHRSRKEIPDMTIATDIIAGFPGEIEEDHLKTLELLKTGKPEIVNLSKYSDRPGTESSKAKNKVPTHVIARRSKQIHELRKEIALKSYQKYVGKELEVLINKVGKKEGQVIGRTSSYVPVLLNESLPLGQFVRVQISHATPTHLIGKISRS